MKELIVSSAAGIRPSLGHTEAKSIAHIFADKGRRKSLLKKKSFNNQSFLMKTIQKKKYSKPIVIRAKNVSLPKTLKKKIKR